VKHPQDEMEREKLRQMVMGDLIPLGSYKGEGKKPRERKKGALIPPTKKIDS